MNVIVDVVNAEAVISGAAGAVAKLQPGIFGVGSAADRAFVVIQLIPLLLTDFFGFSPEVDGGLARLAGKVPEQSPGEKDEKIQDGDDRQKIDRKRTPDDRKQEVCRVNQRQIFHFDRNDEKQQYLLIGEKRRIGEKHGQIQILCVNDDPVATDEINQKSVYDGQKPPDDQINVKLRRAPILLQRAPHPVIEIKYQEGKQPHTGWVDHKGEQTPYLPTQNQRRIEAEIAHQGRVSGSENPENDIGNGQIAHQVWNSKIRMAITETVNQPHGIFQANSPLIKLVIRYYTVFQKESLQKIVKFQNKSFHFRYLVLYCNLNWNIL